MDIYGENIYGCQSTKSYLYTTFEEATEVQALI